MKKLINSVKGFTLIELLIVIAVIGVLAAVVLVAIDPAEQLKRGRDSSRVQETATLGHAIAAYLVTQQSLLSTAPAAANYAGGFQNVLIYSNDIKAQVTGPTNSACANGTSTQGNFCYAENGTSDYLVWTNAESKAAKTKGQCTAAQTAVYVYDSTQGKAGVGCVAGVAPSAGITLY